MKPFTLVRVIVEAPEAPAGMVKLSGLADIVKSGESVAIMTCD